MLLYTNHLEISIFSINQKNMKTIMAQYPKFGGRDFIMYFGRDCCCHAAVDLMSGD